MTVTGGTATLQRHGDHRCALTQSGGHLNGTGTLTVTGLSTLSGVSNYSTESGSGTTIAQGGAAFTVVFGLDGGRTLQLGGASTATGAGAAIDLNNINPNIGLSDAGSGTLTIASGATFNDQTTGSGLTISAPNRGGTDTGVTAAVNNLGTFTKSGAATTSTISTLFNNSGIVNVTSGTLDLSGGGTDVGATYEGSGTVQFGGGTRTLDATSSITGNALFSGGQTTVNGGVGTGLMTVTGGTATFNGTVTTGALTQSGGLSQWLWHADGDGAVDVVGSFELQHRERVGDDDCAGRSDVQRVVVWAGRRADAAAGRGQHGYGRRRSDRSERHQSEHRLKRCGLRDVDDCERGDVQRPDHRQRIDDLRPQPRRHRYRGHRGGEQSRYLHQERQQRRPRPSARCSTTAGSSTSRAGR